MRPVLQPLSLIDRGMILLVIIAVAVLFYVTIDRGWERLRRKTVTDLGFRLK